MRAVIQRVKEACVEVAGETVGAIPFGLLVYIAAAPDDGPADVDYIAGKVARLRVFQDHAGKLNLDVSQAGGRALLVSAFTVLADARKGNRPSFDGSAGRAVAEPLIGALRSAIEGLGVGVETGRFAEDMRVRSINDGPICILIDSRRVL